MSCITNTVANALNQTGETIKEAGSYVTGQSSNKNSLTGNSGLHSDAQKLGSDTEKMKDSAMKDLDKQWDKNVDKAKEQLDKHKS